MIDAIRPVAPTRLYVACDGPNPERLYSDVNQGCRLGVSRAITWFFEQVEEGIILEDDCVTHPDVYAGQPTSHRPDFRITMW